MPLPYEKPVVMLDLALTDECMREVATAAAERVSKSTGSNPALCVPAILLTLQETFKFAPATQPGADVAACIKPWQQRVNLNEMHSTYRNSEALRFAEMEIAELRALLANTSGLISAQQKQLADLRSVAGFAEECGVPADGVTL
jgi:hypothetical protein